MVPSSLTSSHSTPAGRSPASRARSTAASVCPGRRSTPPARARSGTTCPGRDRSAGRVAGSASSRIVCARSAAEMPVLTPVARVDRHRVRGAAPVLVGVVHRRQVEPVAVGLGQRHADVAGGVPDHEREQLRGGLLGGEDQVALVLPVLVVDHHDRPAGGDVRIACSTVPNSSAVTPGHPAAAPRTWRSRRPPG